MFDATADYDFLILPGLGNSGVEHWQSYWAMAFRNGTRVVQDDWDNPKLADWITRLEAALSGGRRPAVLVCHSLSCSLAAHWAAKNVPGRIKAALLVAPSDLERPDAPAGVQDFLPVPRVRFPVPALVAASTDDVYVSIERAREFADAWGADFCNVGELGHINTASRLGLWPQGLLLLGQLLARIKN